MTKQKWIVTGIAIPIILATIGLGFAAMSTNPPFIIPSWLPLFFFVLAALGVIVLGVYLTWGFLTQFRLQTPIININQRGKVNTVSDIIVKKPHIPTRLEYDNVLWEDAGSDGWGGIRVTGPFCPNDLTPLARKFQDKVETYIDNESFISSYHETLVCIQCKTEYLLVNAGVKQLKDSRNEVRTLFEGIRKRKQ